MKTRTVLSIVLIPILFLFTGCKMRYITSPFTHPMFTKKNQTDVELEYMNTYGSHGLCLKANHSLSNKTGLTSIFTHISPINRKSATKIIDKQLGGINYGEVGYMYYISPFRNKHIHIATSLGYGLGAVKTNNFKYRHLPGESRFLPDDYVVKYRFQRIYGQLNWYAMNKNAGIGLAIRMSQILINNSIIYEDIIANSMNKKELGVGFSVLIRINLTKHFYSTFLLNTDTGYLGNELFDTSLAFGAGYNF